MDSSNASPYPRARPPLHSHKSSNSFHRISTVSDITDYDGYGTDEQGNPLHPRPSLVSLPSVSSLKSASDTGRARSDSAGEGHTYAGGPSSWSTLTGSSNNNYEPVPLIIVGGLAPPTRKPSRSYGPNLSFKKRAETIPEEDGIDLGLIKSAAPMAKDEPASDLEPPTPIAVGPDGFTFDLSSSLGPTTKADEDFLKKLQEQEAQGKLTGGLGAGIKAETVLTESNLLAVHNPESSKRNSLVRSLSRVSRSLSSRHEKRLSLQEIGQNEANKRGEVIQIIKDEDAPGAPDTSQGHHSEVDLSVMSGPDTGLRSLHASMRQTTFPTVKKGGPQVFYPQPDWKPFSMRWPYLFWLITISIILGSAQEVLYRKSVQHPLVSFKAPSDISPNEYFAFKFLPTLVAVCYGVMWQITNFEVMRLEAFYQLSKEGGALAGESINVDYITYINFLKPLRALRCRHYTVAVSTIASLLANAAVPILVAASIILRPERDERLKNPDIEKMILIHPVWSRLLTVVFFLIAALGGVLFWQLRGRRSGLLADVKGIVGVASMATVSHILMDFKDMDVAPHKEIHDRLKDHRYVLRNSSLAPLDEYQQKPPSKQEQELFLGRNRLSENAHPLMLRAKGLVPFIIGIFSFLILIPVFLFTPANVITDKAAWSVTVLAVAIKLNWGALDTDVRMMEPYYILSRRHAPPKTLALDYTAMPFGWVAVKGALNGHWLVFFVGLGTVMTEVLTVLVTSLATVNGEVFIALLKGDDTDTSGADGPPGRRRDDHDHYYHDERDRTGNINAGQETVLRFWLSLVLACLVLLYMGVVATVVFVRRRKVFLPRQPNTIASVLAYIHQSKMLYDFVGTAKLSNVEMVRRLEGDDLPNASTHDSVDVNDADGSKEGGAYGVGGYGNTGYGAGAQHIEQAQQRQKKRVKKTYGLGWFQGRDGQSHCGVDEEELLSGYKFGYDYSWATKPWEETQAWL